MSKPAVTSARVLVVEDDPSTRSGMALLLREAGHEVRSAADGCKALGLLESWVPEIVLTDLRMPALGGIELLKRLRDSMPDVAIIVMSGFCSVEGAVEAMQLGADDYLVKPVDFDRVLAAIERALAHRALAVEAKRLRGGTPSRVPESRAGLIGESKPFRDMMELAGQVAAARVPILISGEPGTGKQHLARLIHQMSGRQGALVAVHCGGEAAAIERALFGADAQVLAANGGTLLLVGVDEAPPAIQVRLIGLLEEGAYTGPQGERVVADVRVVATTHRELTEEVSVGRFREDLYYRLAVVKLHAPALRQRRGDIPLLVARFVQRHARQAGKSVVGCTERVLQTLTDHDWSGNVRQLENCIARAVIVARSAEIEARDLPREVLSPTARARGIPMIPGASLPEIERYAILQTLEHTGGSTKRAAKILGISTRKIQYRLNEYGGDTADAGGQGWATARPPRGDEGQDGRVDHA